MNIEEFSELLKSLKELSEKDITIGGYMNKAQWNITAEAFCEMFTCEQSTIDSARDKYSQIETEFCGVKITALVEYEVEEKDGWSRKVPNLPQWWLNGEQAP